MTCFKIIICYEKFFVDFFIFFFTFSERHQIILSFQFMLVKSIIICIVCLFFVCSGPYFQNSDLLTIYLKPSFKTIDTCHTGRTFYTNYHSSNQCLYLSVLDDFLFTILITHFSPYLFQKTLIPGTIQNNRYLYFFLYFTLLIIDTSIAQEVQSRAD